MHFRRLLSNSVSPIVADLGAGSIKLLQVTSSDQPSVVAAREIEFPLDVRGNVDRRFAFLAETLPGMIRNGGFKGRRVVCSPSSSHFTVQQVEVRSDGPVSVDDQVRGEVASRLGCAAANVVARSFVVPSRRGDDRERVCLAIARDDVMQHVDLFKQCRLDLVGVQPDHIAMLNGFRHLHRRREDADVVTMYVDVGWGSVKVVVGRGVELIFARIIQTGGRHLDQVGSEVWNLSQADAHARRLAEESRAQLNPVQEPAAAEGTAVLRAGLAKAQAEQSSVHSDTMVMTERRAGTASDLGPRVVETPPGCLFTEVYESIADELSMCVRYAATSIEGNPIQRLVFLGGESRSRTLAAHLARAIGVKASVGDPLRRFLATTDESSVDFDVSVPHPGWAVACGLCATPVEM
ncbi:MAG: hypothetical protein MK085_04675 [Phycisphaerales bacterium]|nr:hypothetical protein [Phycisphaerales bacterium]